MATKHTAIDLANISKKVYGSVKATVAKHPKDCPIDILKRAFKYHDVSQEHQYMITMYGAQSLMELV